MDRAEQRRGTRGKENARESSPATDCPMRTTRGTVSKQGGKFTK